MARSPVKSRRSAGGEGRKLDGRFDEGNDIGKGTQWTPGQSGNPLGLPKGYAHVRELAKAYTGNGVRALVEVANDEGHAARHIAAKYLLDRGWGTPEQELRVTGAGGGPVRHIDLTKCTNEQLAQLEAIYAAAAAGASAGAVGGAGGEGEEEP